MKKLLIIFVLMAVAMLTSSCQKELPDAIKNVEVSKGDKEKNPTPVPTPDNPSQQGDIPSEDDNPWPSY